MNDNEENPIDEIAEEINPIVRPRRNGQQSPYYVSEADLYAGVMHLYETGEFPEYLAADLLKMCQRIITSRRFHDYPDTLKEEALGSTMIRVSRSPSRKSYRSSAYSASVFCLRRAAESQ